MCGCIAGCIAANISFFLFGCIIHRRQLPRSKSQEKTESEGERTLRRKRVLFWSRITFHTFPIIPRPAFVPLSTNWRQSCKICRGSMNLSKGPKKERKNLFFLPSTHTHNQPIVLRKYTETCVMDDESSWETDAVMLAKGKYLACYLHWRMYNVYSTVTFSSNLGTILKGIGTLPYLIFAAFSLQASRWLVKFTLHL